MNELQPDITWTAALLADRSRVAMLQALDGGRALPAGELARAAGIGAPSASAHLARLARGGLVEAVAQGRHRYFRLASARLPELLEALAALAPAPARPAERSRVPRELRQARWCYGHLGGQVAVAMAQALVARELVTPLDGPCTVTPAGARWLQEAGVVAGDRTVPAVQVCPVDWSERLPHLAGALGRALARHLVDRQHLVPVRGARHFRITARGRSWLRERLGVALDG
jgi:DNA-binding transcriptional ArsR family regulator